MRSTCVYVNVCVCVCVWNPVVATRQSVTHEEYVYVLICLHISCARSDLCMTFFIYHIFLFVHVPSNFGSTKKYVHANT
jgi:hypothetical protein